MRRWNSSRTTRHGDKSLHTPRGRGSRQRPRRRCEGEGDVGVACCGDAVDDTTDDTTVAFLKETLLAQEKEKAALEESEKQAKEQKEQRAMKEARCWTRTAGRSGGRVPYQPSSSSSGEKKKRRRTRTTRSRLVTSSASISRSFSASSSRGVHLTCTVGQLLQHLLLCATQLLLERSTGTTTSVTGVDVNRDGVPNVLQQPLVGHSVLLQGGAPGFCE